MEFLCQLSCHSILQAPKHRGAVKTSLPVSKKQHPLVVRPRAEHNWIKTVLVPGTGYSPQFVPGPAAY